MTKVAQSTTDHKKILLIAAQAPYHRGIDFESYVSEFKSLVKTAGIPYDELVIIKLRDIDPFYFFTKGKLGQLEESCKKADYETIIISESLTVQQERNLEDILETPIIDRTRLILDIFEKAAVSAEGKTQVEIAYFKFLKSRVAGKGVHLDQQKGGIGVRSGSGETAKERELRELDQEINKRKQQLEKLSQSKELQRKRRLKSKEPLICLVGYTNAGKSTILNQLTKSDVLAEDKLFATLDTTTRKLFINSEKIGLLSDTIGFIQQLPHRLIEAFKSTLSELEYADLLLHVIDITDKNWEMHINIVHEILNELNVDKNIMYVFNKVDAIELTPEIKAAMNNYKPNVVISATSKEGIRPLKDALYEWHAATTRPGTLATGKVTCISFF